MTEIAYFGGLWEEDLPEFIEEGKKKGFEVTYGLEEDQHHYYVKYEVFP